MNGHFFFQCSYENNVTPQNVQQHQQQQETLNDFAPVCAFCDTNG